MPRSTRWRKLADTKELYLVTTHVHPEHDLGAQAFPATTTLIRSSDQVKDIAEFGLRLAKAFASRSALHAELLKDADFRKAIHLRAKLRPDIGGVQAKLIAMGGHGPDACTSCVAFDFDGDQLGLLHRHRPKTTGERRHGSAVFFASPTDVLVNAGSDR